MKFKNKMYVARYGPEVWNYVASSRGAIAGNTQEFIFHNFSFEDEILWSIFASNPDYIKIGGGL